MRHPALLPVLLAALTGCQGVISDPTAGAGGGDADPRDPHSQPARETLEDPAALGESGVRRLSRREYRATSIALVGVDPAGDVELLPGDSQNPFDNDYTVQAASAALLEGVKAIAERVAERAVADAEARARVVPCTPSGPGDAGCFREFLESFGRRALRRPLTAEEIDGSAEAPGLASLLSEHAVPADDFWLAVELALRVFLQHPELLHRIELGSPVPDKPNLYRLDSWEVATRLAFLLWGTGPDDRLLDVAAADGLATPDQVRSVAAWMIEDPRTVGQIQDMHAMWLGYDSLPVAPDLAERMRTEVDALVERVVFEERRSWLDLFTLEDTWVDGALATHYGLPGIAAEDGWAWVPWDAERGGILSTGAILSNGTSADGDTSLTERGKFIRNRLLCQEIPPPPPDSGVAVDEGLVCSDDLCKSECAEVHAQGGCAGCHQLMDPLGMGLERFDAQGRYRTHERERPDCQVDGVGTFIDTGETFVGPGDLGALLSETDQMRLCFVTHVHRFAIGRVETADDRALLAELVLRFERNDHRLDELLLEYVGSPAFLHRWIQENE